MISRDRLYSVRVISEQLLEGFASVAHSPDPDLAVAALRIARVAYPRLDEGAYLEQLDDLGREAARRVSDAVAHPDEVPAGVDPLVFAQIAALNEYLFTDLRFVGNRVQYEDPRNSFLNEVLDRRTGIPITLALVYKEVAKRAGVVVNGVNFPGHFLLRRPATPGSRYTRDLIIDAQNGGALLTEGMCRELLHRQAGDDAVWNQDLLAHASTRQILVRMLVNLKRSYVRMHSFPQALDITDLLLAIDPLSANELRDRGLLAYHLNDFPAALRDLQRYLSLLPKGEREQDDRDEQNEIWEHVKTLTRRVAALN